jgi:hypothetical protein
MSRVVKLAEMKKSGMMQGRTAYDEAERTMGEGSKIWRSANHLRCRLVLPALLFNFYRLLNLAQFVKLKLAASKIKVI